MVCFIHFIVVLLCICNFPQVEIKLQHKMINLIKNLTDNDSKAIRLVEINVCKLKRTFIGAQ